MTRADIDSASFIVDDNPYFVDFNNASGALLVEFSLYMLEDDASKYLESDIDQKSKDIASNIRTKVVNWFLDGEDDDAMNVTIYLSESSAVEYSAEETEWYETPIIIATAIIVAIC